MSVTRVAVIGSGPSGAYTAQLLTEESESPVEVDVFDRLATPFGLVRYGVAPDHPRVKSITTSFAEVFDETPGVRFLGNVEIGRDLSIAELREHYDAVVFAHGAPLDRRLGIDGEDLDGVDAVRQFVSWYQGHPDQAADAFVLQGGTRAVVIGVGNVALDAARMLVREVEDLRKTDIPEHIVEAFAASTIDEVVVIGRRGPAFAKFTNKEFIELLEVDSTDVVIDAADLELDEVQQAHLASDPAAKRLVATFQKAADRGVLGRRKTIRFVFDRTPVEFLGDGTVTGIRLRATSDPSVVEDLPVDLALRSVGYLGKPLEGLPFDERAGVVPSRDSRVIDGDDVVEGVYVAGWIKRGPNGVVGTNRKCALETVESVLADVAARGGASTASSAETVDALLRGRDVRVVDWSDWRAIEAAEIAAGEAVGRERIKLHIRAEQLRAAELAGATAGV
ncbi:FAD-dependent oxidoreductase [Agromyces seonyuensis]|uniref:ferredoxin--NADP(+) reductase n=1 Tax=Agromyces seonyuensis TaxID=2662446 RepID=A0A6I4NTI5_9MICO|nr:FAD-dependent oxidoreductase [Agromyces seonyuensis]MWB97553.1 NADP oxidoreductase [Agromyces seonyuensis]